MKTAQAHVRSQSQLEAALAKMKTLEPQLILAFGNTSAFAKDGWAATLSKEFSSATVIGCSTAGEITNGGVFDKTLVMNAVHFDEATLKSASAKVESMEETHAAGVKLASQFDTKGLRAVFLLGCGLNINGSALIEGIRQVVGPKVVITGGLAGDDGKFQQTFTVLNGEISDRHVVALGIYGENVGISFGSMGGWEAFGPVRKVTKSKANVLFELDGEPALDIYKKYLGDKVKDLPASGLLYPFALLKDNQDSMGLVRTILGVDEVAKSLTLAGDIPENGIVRLMHTSNDGLIAGAKSAASHAVDLMKIPADGKMASDSLSILISCVGRKLIMGDEIEDEFDAVKEVLSSGTLTGFYSYGEIAPQGEFVSSCSLHNQTMTITHIYETKRPA